MTLARHFCFNQEEMEKTKNSWHNYTFLVSSSLCREKLFCGYKLLTYPAPPPPKKTFTLRNQTCSLLAIQTHLQKYWNSDKGSKICHEQNCKGQGSPNFPCPWWSLRQKSTKNMSCLLWTNERKLVKKAAKREVVFFTEATLSLYL